jgi:glucose-1-phosphate thymidylyltransferase
VNVILEERQTTDFITAALSQPRSAKTGSAVHKREKNHMLQQVGDKEVEQKKTCEEALVAVILAGGSGGRMGTTGAQIPKVYLHVGLEPVINRPVSRCLEIKDIKKVFVLTRRRHPDLPTADLEYWAETWKKLWYENEQRIEIVYEEDLQEVHSTLDKLGAVVALNRIVRKFAAEPSPPSHVLIAAGDNFIDYNIAALVQASSKAKDDVIIAARFIPKKQVARRRFGVVQIDRGQGNTITGYKVTGYQEKPEDPLSSDVSIGLYVFPVKELQRIEEYLEYVSKLPLSQEQKARVGAPGYFLEWLVNNKQTPVRAVMFEKGIWVDVGTPSSYLITVLQHMSNLIQQPKSARDLDVLGSTKNLSDKYCFLCHRAKITRDGRRNVISLYFQGDDAIATLNKKAADENVLYIKDVVAENEGKNAEFWSALESRKNAEFAAGDSPRDLGKPVLISGGVFPIDSAGAATYEREKALVPFLMRDFGAPVDAGRLTTAAGHMDKLDLVDVCVSEHAEEMIFFGSSHAADQTRILICAPREWQNLARDMVLARLAESRILVPGIDPRQIDLERRPESIGLTVPVWTTILAPPLKFNYEVQIFYRESERDMWQSRHEYKNLVLISDPKSATLEFRMLWLSDLTVGVATGGNVPRYDEETESLGRLLGIVDGDGHSRTALIVKAQALMDYVRAMKKESLGDIMFASDCEHRPTLETVAATYGHTGRFSNSGRSPDSGRKLPMAPLTTSVNSFAEILDNNLKDG